MPGHAVHGVVLTSMVLLLSGMATPALADTHPPADPGPAVSPGNSLADVRILDFGGLDSIEVTARASEGSVEGTALGSPEVCVSAVVSELRTEPSATGERTIRVTREVFGCAQPVYEYRFDPIGWEAHARAKIPSTFWTYTSELQDGEWVSVGVTEKRVAATVVDLRWKGEGEPRTTPWLYLHPYPCFGPPFVCGVGAGVTSISDATVEGSFDVRGFGVSGSMPSDQGGRLAWWI